MATKRPPEPDLTSVDETLASDAAAPAEAESSGHGVQPDHSSHEQPEEDEFLFLVLFQMGSGAGGSLNRTVVQDIVQMLGGLSAGKRPNSRIDVWLESPGGDAHAAYKLGLFLRSRFEIVNFFIMDYAKSAATLLSLAGDRIYMAPAAELGPLDTQENREGEVRMRSLLDTANSIDTLFTQAILNALGAGSFILNQTALTREKTIESVLQFAATFTRPLLEQIDPIAVNAANTSLNVASEYGARLLSYRNGRDGLGRAKAQTEKLVRDYPTHGYVIDRDEAREVLDLPVENLEDYEHLDLLENLYSQVQRAGANVIRLFTLEELTTILSPDTPDEGEENDAVDEADNLDEPTVPN